MRAPRPELVHIRLSGSPESVSLVAERLRRDLAVLQESPDYPNRRDAGVRRYLDVLVGDDVGGKGRTDG
jgi:hypothetical protein